MKRILLQIIPILISFSCFGYEWPDANQPSDSLVSTPTAIFTDLQDPLHTSLSILKPRIDEMILDGVNNLFFDDADYITLNNGNPVWRDVSALKDYLSRIMAFMNVGTPVETVLEDEEIFSKAGLLWTLRQDEDGYHYFISNMSGKDVYMPVGISKDFVDALWYDPMTGEIYPATIYNQHIEMEFADGESRILRLYDHACNKQGQRMRIRPYDIMEIDLENNKWTLQFIDTNPQINKTYKLKHLQPWTSLDEKKVRNLTGTGIYTTTVNISDDDLAYDWFLDLGEINGSARVYINCNLVATLWAKPFFVNIGDFLNPGKNEILIEVSSFPVYETGDVFGLNSAKLIRR